LYARDSKLSFLIGIHHQKVSVPQAAPSKIAAVKPAAAASATTPRTQRDSRTAIWTMVLKSAALIARNKGVTKRLHPSLKDGYKATFTTLYDSLNELLEVAARWSPNCSSI